MNEQPMSAAEIGAHVLMLKSHDELRTVQDAVQFRWKLLDSQSARKFRAGDTVEFESRRTGQRVKATVEKVNRKTIQVRQVGGFMVWNVSPSLLSKVAA